MRAAAVGLSLAESGAAAGAEAVGAACAGLAAHTVLLFAAGHTDPAPVVAAARAAGRGARVVGCASVGVIAGARELEDGPAVAALAIAAEDVVATPFWAATPATLPPAPRLQRAGLALAFADAYTTPPDDLCAGLAAAWPGWTIAGGVATAEGGIYPALRWLDDEVRETGLAGLLLSSPGGAIVGVTAGCQPVGPPHVVTAARGRVISALDGQPAFEVFAERARPLLDDLPRAAQAVLLAVPGPSDDADVALRGLVGFDPERGLLASSEPIAEGTPVRFALRDAGAAREHLRRTVADVARRLEGRTPRFGVYICCSGRGRALYDIADHDVSFIQGTLGSFPLVGFFGGGEITPGVPRPRLGLFSAVLAVMPWAPAGGAQAQRGSW